jgi:hypothetical protein
MSAIRVYVNGRGVDVPSGASVLDAVRVHDPRLAQLVVDGSRALADSRGLPLDPEAPAFTGAIVRVISGVHRASDAGQ